jgi:hypothetical protein
MKRPSRSKRVIRLNGLQQWSSQAGRLAPRQDSTLGNSLLVIFDKLVRSCDNVSPSGDEDQNGFALAMLLKYVEQLVIKRLGELELVLLFPRIGINVPF